MTPTQTNIIVYTKLKVKKLFEDCPVPAHDFGHVSRVTAWVKEICKNEKADLFLCEMAGWLHDIGRTLEKDHGVISQHHELSYKMCKDWFKNDPVLKGMTKRQKDVILYAVRYHWNDAADKYKEAIILRDADKLDVFGPMGVKRVQEYCRGDAQKLQTTIRFLYAMVYWIRTDTGKKLVYDGRLKFLNHFYRQMLRSKIKMR